MLLSIEKGFYKHQEQLVIYRDTKGVIWARPETMWTEKVKDKLRFERFTDQKEGRLKFYLFKRMDKINN